MFFIFIFNFKIFKIYFRLKIILNFHDPGIIFHTISGVLSRDCENLKNIYIETVAYIRNY
jgi:hypothetical protein